MAVAERLARTSVLLVEDESSLRTMLTHFLETKGYDVTPAEDVEAAQKALGQRHFDVLLTDLRLGEKCGFDLLRELGDLAPQTRAIVMSAVATARDYQEATALGAVKFLCKPFSHEQLLEAIQQAVDCETGFRGSVHGLSLTDVLQMFHYARRSVVIRVGGTGQGRIFLSGGQVVHAEASGQVGEEALRVLLQASAGSIATSALVDDVERTIDRDMHVVLLDSLRQIDEGSGRKDENDIDWSPAERRSAPGDDERRRDMASEKELQDVLGKIEAEIAGFIGASIVDLESGMTLAVKANRPDFDLTAASAYNSEMVKQKLKIIRVLNLKSQLEDMLLTLSDQIHLIKIVNPGTFMYLAADKASTNLAIVRSVVNKHLANLK